LELRDTGPHLVEYSRSMGNAGGGVVRTCLSVQPAMRCEVYHLKILNRVVERIPVFVVDVHPFRDWASIVLPDLTMQGTDSFLDVARVRVVIIAKL
jgi:hypothetical protein